MIESFGAGTAAIVSPVKKIHYQGEDLVIPLDPEDTSSQAGKLAKRLSQSIMDIQYGRAQDPHGWSIVI
jgi:branched-chain amino acid aminotransferase